MGQISENNCLVPSDSNEEGKYSNLSDQATLCQNIMLTKVFFACFMSSVISSTSIIFFFIWISSMLISACCIAFIINSLASLFSSKFIDSTVYAGHMEFTAISQIFSKKKLISSPFNFPFHLERTESTEEFSFIFPSHLENSFSKFLWILNFCFFLSKRVLFSPHIWISESFSDITVVSCISNEYWYSLFLIKKPISKKLGSFLFFSSSEKEITHWSMLSVLTK